MIHDARHIFFVGIGGIGMSSLARYFHSTGRTVSGYDKTPSPLTDKLMEEGINVSFDESVDAFNAQFPFKSNEALIVYTPAIPVTSQLMKHLLDEGYVVKKRAEVLGLITSETINLSIAGTHGKTTTSCLLSHLLISAGLPTAAFLGGISANLNGNYYNNIPEGTLGYSVSEADEFDRSFLHLKPSTAAITSIDADHLDIYGDEKNIQESFVDFAKCVNPKGKLYVQVDHQTKFQQAGIKVVTYGIEAGMVMGGNVHINGDQYVFDLYYQNEVVRNLSVGIPGRHNVENAIVASAIALDCGISEDELRAGLSTFRGVKRRFEYVLKEPVVFIDDYAHHPTELRAFISSVRSMYPERSILGVFQPHLYSRTRDFAASFAESLSLLDILLILDIYPAREEPIEGVNSELILKDVTCQKRLVSKTELADTITSYSPEVILTMGAGDIDRLVEPIKQALL